MPLKLFVFFLYHYHYNNAIHRYIGENVTVDLVEKAWVLDLDYIWVQILTLSLVSMIMSPGKLFSVFQT